MLYGPRHSPGERSAAPFHWIVGLLLLVAYFSESTNARSSGAQVLDVHENEFVSLHVGYPGTSITFLIRWDINDVYIMPSTELSRFSRTYSDTSNTKPAAAGGGITDIVCFGIECIRTRLALTYGLPSNPDMFHLGLTLSNYKGILGLGTRSPIWEHFRYYSYNSQELVLSHLPIGLLQNEGAMEYCVAGNYVPISLDSRRYWALVDMSTDYSFLPVWLVGAPPGSGAVDSTAIKARPHWKLGLFNGKYSVRIDRALIHEATNDGVVVSTLRPMSSRVVSNRAARVNALNQILPGWNGTDIVVLGRYFLSAGFTVYSDTLSGQTALSLHWMHKPWLVRFDYQWLYAVFIGLLYIWIFVLQESVDYSAAVAYTLKFAQQDRALSFSTDPAAFPVVFPTALKTAHTWSLTRTSHRNLDFVGALSFGTQLAVVAFLCSIIYGYGFMHQFWRHHFDAHDHAAIYSSLAMALIHVASAGAMDVLPSTSVIWGQNVCLICIWLLGMMDRFSFGAVIVMLLASGWGATYAIQQFSDLMIGRIWPSSVYTGSVPRRLFWTVVLGTIAAWWAWIFAFYTIPLIVRNWQPSRPSDWGLSLIALAIVVSIAYRNISREFSVRSNLRITTLIALNEINNKMLRVLKRPINAAPAVRK